MSITYWPNASFLPFVFAGISRIHDPRSFSGEDGISIATSIINLVTNILKNDISKLDDMEPIVSTAITLIQGWDCTSTIITLGFNDAGIVGLFKARDAY